MLCKEWNLGETQFAYILIFIILFYFILTWRSNYLILLLTLFIDFRILFIFWVTTFVVMMRVVFIQVMVLMEMFDSFHFVQGLVLKINFSFSKSFLLRCETWQVFIRNSNNIIYILRSSFFIKFYCVGNLICDRHWLPFWQAR